MWNPSLVEGLRSRCPPGLGPSVKTRKDAHFFQGDTLIALRLEYDRSAIGVSHPFLTP